MATTHKKLIGTAVAGALALAVLAQSSVNHADAQTGRIRLEPPLVTLYNKQISNDEIFYIGGEALVPEATVIIYLQGEGGATRSYEVTTDARGAWFYSIPEFLSRGRYTLWTQLKTNEILSPPGPQLNIDVMTTALQLGKKRFGYEGMYLIAALGFLAALLIIIAFAAMHFRAHRKKSQRLAKEIAEAETSIRRGFAVLRRDIFAELEAFRQVKKPDDMTPQDREREAKILQDLQWVENYIGKEIWDIEHLEKTNP